MTAVPRFQRLLFALAVLLAAGLFALVALALPPEGAVAGVCVDAKTGRPLARVAVSLTRKTDAGEEENTRANDGRDDAPPGWRQDSEGDQTRGMGGASREPRTEWQTRADAQGRFRLPHVPAGEYELSATSSGHDLPDARGVVVLDGQTAQIRVPLQAARPRLSFESPARNWTPSEEPTLPLRGLLPTRAVSVSIDRLDLDGALLRMPAWLARPQSRASDDGPPAHPLPAWPSQFSPVRRWTYAVTKADEEGSFYERVPLGRLPSGLYRVSARTAVGGQMLETVGWARVTHLALVRKAWGTNLLAYVTDLTTGRPIPNLAVQLYDRGAAGVKRLGETRTSPDGLARFETVGADKESEGVLVARDGESLTALALDLNSSNTEDSEGDSESDTATAQDWRAFIYTDRPVYRPGQTVNIKGVARWFGARDGFVVPAGEAVTLDVRDAQDTLVSHQEARANAAGSWTATVTLSPEALTGEYLIRAEMGGASREGTFTVAAYQKPEYQAAVAFSRPRYVRGETIDATVTATYYYGAPVSNGTATLTAYRGESAGGEGETDGETSLSGEPVVAQTVHLDGSGQAHLRVPTRGKTDTLGDQSYTISADIDDGSGRPVHAEASIIVAQGLFSLEATPSVRIARPGQSVTVDVRATDALGHPQAGQDIRIQAGYEAWTDGQETWTPVSGAHVATSPAGAATATVTPPRVGLLTFHVSAKDARGNVITTQADLWVPGDDQDMPARLPDLSVVLDRKKYAPGDTARVLINSARPGPSALVTVEGRGLYRTLVVPLSRRSVALDVPVGPDFAPSVTVSVCAVADKQFRSTSAQLVVQDTRRALQVAVRPDHSRYHPGDPATIQVRTRDGAGKPVPAEVSVGVVDSAVYAIQPEGTETIGAAMQPDQENAVGTDNSCDDIYLGDVDKGATGIDIRRKFPDTALWKPDVQTGADGNATVRLTLPDNLTTWRITAIGHTPDTQVGKGVGTMTVDKDLLVRLETPPFLTEGDTGEIVALVHNNTAKPLRAQIRLAASNLDISGSANREMTVAPGQPARLVWNATARRSQSATIQVTARAGALSDGVEQTIPIAPHGATQRVWHSGTLLRRVSQTVSLDPSAIPGATRLRVRLSPSIASTLRPAAEYLSAYPYGSTDATASVLAASAATGSFRDRAARAILRLARDQRADGGWGWFSTGPADFEMTAQAAWSLSLAPDIGLTVNPTILQAAARDLKTLAASKQARRDGYDDRLPRVALALARLGERAAARETVRGLQHGWARHPDDRRPQDLAMAALAEQESGAAGDALALMGDIWKQARETGSLCAWTARAHRTIAGAASDLPDVETTAWALLAALTVTPADPRIDGAARWLMTRRSGDHWESPQTTAIVLLSLARYQARAHEREPEFDARVLVNGRFVRQIHFGTASLREPDKTLDLPGTALRPGINTISLEKVGTGRLYYALELSQSLRQAAPPPPPSLWTRLLAHLRPPAPLPPAPSGVRVKRVYLRLTSRRNFLWEDTVPTPDTHLRAGESVLVRLIFQCVRPAARVVIEEPVPPGCRVAETSGEFASSWDNWWDYTDVRDDKIVFFARDLTPGEHEITYHLRAQTLGVYDIMPTLLTSTADPTLYALGRKADRIEIGANK